MFEMAELGHQLNKADYRARVPELRTLLLEAQFALRKADFPVIVLISGVDGAGKGATINRLNEWLDPRYLRADAFDSHRGRTYASGVLALLACLAGQGADGSVCRFLV